MTTAALDMATGSLGATKTYARRDWVWLPCGPWDYPDHRIGTLTLVMQKSRRAGAVQEVDHYAVQEETDEALPEGIRSFLLENETKPHPDGPYRCVVGALRETCSCKAGQIDRPRVEEVGCKHRSAIAALINEGVI